MSEGRLLEITQDARLCAMLLPANVFFLIFSINGINFLLPKVQLIVKVSTLIFPFFVPLLDEVALFYPCLMLLFKVAIILLLAFH